MPVPPAAEVSCVPRPAAGGLRGNHTHAHTHTPAKLTLRGVSETTEDSSPPNAECEPDTRQPNAVRVPFPQNRTVSQQGAAVTLPAFAEKLVISQRSYEQGT